MPVWKAQLPGVEDMHVAVMGCVVNGPGESKHANIGISLPGSGEKPVAPVFVDGEKTVTLKGERIAEEFQAIVEDYVRATLRARARRAPTRRAAQEDHRRSRPAGRHEPRSCRPIRGMNDVLPDETPAVGALRGRRAATCSAQYGYRNIRMPIVEPTALFVRAIGEVTDIVEKEMYTFDDRSTARA